jgi:hypothetical protein
LNPYALWALAPQASASANFATSALLVNLLSISKDRLEIGGGGWNEMGIGMDVMGAEAVAFAYRGSARLLAVFGRPKTDRRACAGDIFTSTG